MDTVISMLFSTMMNFEINVLSVSTGYKACQSECNRFEGHLPYLFEGKSHY